MKTSWRQTNPLLSARNDKIWFLFVSMAFQSVLLSVIVLTLSFSICTYSVLQINSNRANYSRKHGISSLKLVFRSSQRWWQASDLFPCSKGNKPGIPLLLDHLQFPQKLELMQELVVRKNHSNFHLVIAMATSNLAVLPTRTLPLHQVCEVSNNIIFTSSCNIVITDISTLASYN